MVHVCPACGHPPLLLSPLQVISGRCDSSHVCIPAASREALHVRGSDEVLLKNRPASFAFWSFCLLDGLSGVASTNVCPCCCASCSLLPSSPTCQLSSGKQCPGRVFWRAGEEFCWFLNFTGKSASAQDKKRIVLPVFLFSHTRQSPTCRTASGKLK